MKKSFLYLPILACVMLSCTGTEKEEQACLKTITVDTENPITTYEEANLIEEVKLLPLGNEVPVGDIRKIKIIKDKLILLGYHPSDQIFIFSMHTGKFIKKIDKKGRGPGEYMFASDFYVDEELEHIEILNSSHKQIFKYKLNGDFIKSIKLPYYFNVFSKIKEDYIFSKTIGKNEIYNKESMYKLFFWNEKSKMKARYFKVPPEKTSNIIAVSRPQLQDGYKSLTFQPIYTPVIYEINKKLELNPKYCLDFGDAWITDRLAYPKKKNEGDDVALHVIKYYMNIEKSGKVFHVNFLEDDRYVLVYYFKGNPRNRYVCLHDKQTGSSQVFKANNSNLCLGNEYVAYHDGYFVCIKQPFQLKEYLKNNSEILTDKQKSMIEKTEETDNPILMLTKFRDKTSAN